MIVVSKLGFLIKAFQSKKVIRILLFSTFIALASCGGGGSGEDIGDEGPVIVGTGIIIYGTAAEGMVGGIIIVSPIVIVRY